MENNIDDIVQRLKQQQPTDHKADRQTDAIIEAITRQPLVRPVPNWLIRTRQISCAVACMLLVIGMAHPLKCFVGSVGKRHTDAYTLHPMSQVKSIDDLHQIFQYKKERNRMIAEYKKTSDYENQ